MSNDNASWNLFILMKDGKPIRSALFMEDAQEAESRFRLSSPNSDFEIVIMKGENCLFAAPPGAVYKYNGKKEIITGTSSKPFEDGDIEKFRYYEA